MPKKAKHCVVNTWVAIALLCFLYSSGIQQTENIEICQGVGIGLHYLSLCCLFWMTVSARYGSTQDIIALETFKILYNYLETNAFIIFYQQHV